MLPLFNAEIFGEKIHRKRHTHNFHKRLNYIFISVFFSFEKIDNIDSVRSKNPFIPSILLFHFLICRLALTSSHSLPQFKTLLAIAKYCKKDRIKVPKANINHDVIEKTKLYLSMKLKWSTHIALKHTLTYRLDVCTYMQWIIMFARDHPLHIAIIIRKHERFIYNFNGL